MTGKPVGTPGGAPGSKGEGEGGTSVGEFAGLGLQFAVSIIVFLYAGQWLDRKLGTAPWLLMIGVFVGAGASFYSMYRKLMAAQAREEAAKAARRAGKAP
jgi:F0F1-type ATP synthase assembly protein I